MTRPLVSVLMTAYNRETLIPEAIDSVLASTYPNFELIIVDDGSKDRTVEIIKDYERRDSRVRVYINEKNLGDYPNRNKAATYASGKYIKYLDSDDYIYPHGLEVMVNSMEKFPGSGFGMMSRGDYTAPYPTLLAPRATYLEHFNGFGHLDRAPGSAIINRQIFFDLGCFGTRKMVSDQEFWFKIGSLYPMVKIVDDLYWPRTHEGRETTDEINRVDDYGQKRKDIVEKALAGPQCPLTAEDIAAIREKIRKNEQRNRLYGKLSKIKRFFK